MPSSVRRGEAIALRPGVFCAASHRRKRRDLRPSDRRRRAIGRGRGRARRPGAKIAPSATICWGAEGGAAEGWGAEGGGQKAGGQRAARGERAGRQMRRRG